eukprot:528321-Prymnesium_polylepis.1
MPLVRPCSAAVLPARAAGFSVLLRALERSSVASAQPGLAIARPSAVQPSVVSRQPGSTSSVSNVWLAAACCAMPSKQGVFVSPARTNSPAARNSVYSTNAWPITRERRLRSARTRSATRPSSCGSRSSSPGSS